MSEDDEEEKYYSPCDDCELTYINQFSGCRFASSAINDSLNYYDED